MRKARSPAELGFTSHDRRRLATSLHQTQEAKVYQRVQAVLLIAQGYSLVEVARIIGSQRRSVYYWMYRYLDHRRVADLYDASRAGRPRSDYSRRCERVGSCAAPKPSFRLPDVMQNELCSVY